MGRGARRARGPRRAVAPATARRTSTGHRRGSPALRSPPAPGRARHTTRGCARGSPDRAILERPRALCDGLGQGLVASAGQEIRGGGLWKSAVLSQVPLLAEDLERGGHLYPSGRLDADLQQVDLRDFNSWRMTLAE